MRETLTIKRKIPQKAVTGLLRFVLQKDNRYVLQQQFAVVVDEEVVEQWHNIPVVLEKDIAGYKPLKLVVAKKGKVE